MIRRFFYILLLLILPSFMAYSAPKVLTTRIQTLTPPKKHLNLSDSLNIAIIASIYNDTRPDSLIKVDYPTDSLLAVKAAFALKNRLESSPIFVAYDFPVYNFNRDSSSKLSMEAVPVDVAQKIADDVQADYLLTVDIVNTEIWYEVSYAKYDDETVGYASTNVAYQFMFRYYDINNNTIKDTQMVHDTLVIETSAFTTELMNLFNNILTGNEAIVAAVEQAGEAYADLIAPNWTEEVRQYYSDGSRGMKTAIKHVEKEEWNKAMDIWLEYTTLSNQRQAAMGCFNMAVGCEMMGDYELAIEWLNLAKKKDSRLDLLGYEQVLYRRLNDKTEIDKLLK